MPVPHKRLARLTLIASLCAVATIAMVAFAIWEALQVPTPESGVGYLPVAPDPRGPGLPLVLALIATVVGHLFALAAAHTRVSMQVLARDPRIPPDVSAEVRRMRQQLLDRHDGQDDPRATGARTALNDGITAAALAGSALPASDALAGRDVAVRVTVLVPAHNEELLLPAAVGSLRAQSRPPDRVIVVSDNSVDATVATARGLGVEVIETVDNTEKKAGALNQVLHDLLPTLGIEDVVMIMDADTMLTPDFLRVALERLEDDPDLMAVGGVFYGEPGGGLVAQLQRNEYTRYQRIIGRNKGRVFVLTGTASLIRGYALAEVARRRGTLIPGPPGRVYDTWALTEDNELTLALKSLGARMVSPQECRCVTELMPNWQALWRQRSRWQRGALENLAAYGPSRTTALYWGQQIAIGYGVIALNAYLLLMFVTLLSASSFAISLFWAIIGMIFVAERVVTVWAAGWRGRLLALPLLIELAYALFLQAVYVKALVDIATGRASGWNTVVRQEATLS